MWVVCACVANGDVNPTYGAVELFNTMFIESLKLGSSGMSVSSSSVKVRGVTLDADVRGGDDSSAFFSYFPVLLGVDVDSMLGWCRLVASFCTKLISSFVAACNARRCTWTTGHCAAVVLRV